MLLGLSCSRWSAVALLCCGLCVAAPGARGDDEVLKPTGSNKPALKKVKPKSEQAGEKQTPPEKPGSAEKPGQAEPKPAPTDGKPGSSDGKSAPGDKPAKTAPSADPQENHGPPPGNAGRTPAIKGALEAWKAGRLIEARGELNALLAASTNEAEQSELRGYLTQLADETVFGAGVFADDPLIERYKVQSGEVLVKIAHKFKVPVETLSAMRGGERELGAGEVIKIPRGPFTAKISKSQFRLDLYLQDTFVRSFPVGLGLEGGTPTGKWRIADRQRKPTWYPPASAKDRKVRGPNDPLNPLGGYWIKMEGVEGEAVGRTGFGIHGTIEPETVGKAASLGCIRMLPADIDFVYRSLQPGASTVTVVP